MQTNNILIDILPESVLISGKQIPINTDFRIGIMFEQLILDDGVDFEEKISCALEMYYGVAELTDLNEAVERMSWFYKCGTEEDERKLKYMKENNIKSKNKRVYDFGQDAFLIYAAFYSQYGTDLQDIENLHWWKFCALFRGLDESNEIVKIMGIRGTDANAVKDKTEAARIRKLQAKYKIK
ncbi:MAG: bacteriophage Gp15 family protein [Oscillospiraceae bacterium]|nr:bacteriophage Gp15 family protein [Oscillospiraceae bacterium]